MIIDTLRTKYGTYLHLRSAPGAAAHVIVWNSHGRERWYWRWPEERLLGHDTNMFVALEFAMVDYDKIVAGDTEEINRRAVAS
jgi:hypothetical protein